MESGAFKNDDSGLLKDVARVDDERRQAGLEGLTGGLEGVVVNVQPEDLTPAVREFLATTGYVFDRAFEDAKLRTCVLTLPGSADFLFQARLSGDNPFRPYNWGPKTGARPDARLETYVYSCEDVGEYERIQKARGVAFDGGVERTRSARRITVRPSRYTGNALGFVQWMKGERRWESADARPLPLVLEKPDWPHLRRIGFLDHSATRVRAEERNAAILEFMELTSYKFKFAIYVESMNSITSVARLTLDDYAQVFTSGIAPFAGLENSGPTEKYIYNYGARTHHVAFRTEEIEATFEALKAQGVGFLTELVGSPEEGLRQAFTETVPYTYLVYEYIQRYGDFDGFFTKSNVTELTRATDRQ